MFRRIGFAALAAFAFTTAGCQYTNAALTETPAYKSVLIKDIPHVRQKPDFCGEACAEMVLRKLGKNIDQDFVYDQSGLSPLHGRGCYAPELSTALSRIGFRTGRVWYSVQARNAAEEMESQFKTLHADLVAGVPSIVCMHYDDSANTTEHFRLIVGYDAEADEVIYHEPAVHRGAHQRMKRETLIKLWPLKYDAAEWTVIRFRLEPGRIIDGESATELTSADYAQHVLQLKRRLEQYKQNLRQETTRLVQAKDRVDRQRKRLEEERKTVEQQPDSPERKKKIEELRGDIAALSTRSARLAANISEVNSLPREQFHIVLQEPFVVIGNESPTTVNSWATGTIKWAIDRIKRDYFKQDPDHVIDIWLLGDNASYEWYTREIMGRWPTTPFGFYSSWKNALIMNINTGGGTLVHELVHPYIATNFPDCPSWFNEGLASLYEQCDDRNGHIWGLTNWRLHGLQDAIKADRVPSFETLCSTTTAEFYNEDPGTNYSQARYLCYYLQQHGLLVKYYHDFVRAVQEDPTGYETLKTVLGEDDMDEFKKKWQEYILQLRF